MYDASPPLLGQMAFVKQNGTVSGSLDRAWMHVGGGGCPQTLVPKFPRGRRVETEPALPMEKQGDRGAAHLSFNPGCGFRPHKGALPLRDFSLQGRKKKIGTQHPGCKPLDFKLGLLAFHCVDRQCLVLAEYCFSAEHSQLWR